MPYEIQVKTIKNQRFTTLHDSIKPHDYPSDWNKPHDTLFDQNMGGIKQTCGIKPTVWSIPHSRVLRHRQ